MEFGVPFQRTSNNPDLWDARTGVSAEPIDPTLDPLIRCDSAGWNCDPDFAQLLHAMATELRFEKRYRLWQDLQRLFWERVPVIHYGFRTAMQGMRKHVHGPFDMPVPYFWNVWVEK